METDLVFKAVQAALPAGRRQAEAAAVFNALAEQLPRLRTVPDRWELFVELLIAAESEDLIVLPARGGDGWNQHLVPARPKWVRLPPVSAPTDNFDHRAFPWNPRLSFLAAESRLPKGVREAALAVQRFFARGELAPVVAPIKERSFDIFEDEKRLEGLQHSTILFGANKLSLEHLRCYVVPQTPVAERFPAGHGIIVLENEATFDSFCRLSRHKAAYALVVYGRGHEIQKCTAYLRREAERLAVSQVEYFGDVDRRGLEIPAQLAGDGSLGVALMPFIAGYEAVLQNAAMAKDDPPACCQWLPPELAGRAATVLAEDRRLPQEAFGWERIAAYYQLDPLLR
ncbi:MAG TPA: DUF2220 family protein [Opitutaceae bacterium]|nr:DUF2220 family protein [Opitutaceae bacterium]